MDYLLIALGIIFILGGIAGCLIPVIPGPPLSYIGLLFLHLTSAFQFSDQFLIIWAVITAFVLGLDYIIPAWVTKKSGGSKYGVWGSVVGLLVGLFLFPPVGIIVGPFAGAVIGELAYGKNSLAALKSGFGSFMGFLAGTLLKLIASGLMGWYFFMELFA